MQRAAVRDGEDAAAGVARGDRLERARDARGDIVDRLAAAGDARRRVGRRQRRPRLGLRGGRLGARAAGEARADVALPQPRVLPDRRRRQPERGGERGGRLVRPQQAAAVDGVILAPARRERRRERRRLARAARVERRPRGRGALQALLGVVVGLAVAHQSDLDRGGAHAAYELGGPLVFCCVWRGGLRRRRRRCWRRRRLKRCARAHFLNRSIHPPLLPSTTTTAPHPANLRLLQLAVGLPRRRREARRHGGAHALCVCARRGPRHARAARAARGAFVELVAVKRKGLQRVNGSSYKMAVCLWNCI